MKRTFLLLMAFLPLFSFAESAGWGDVDRQKLQYLSETVVDIQNNTLHSATYVEFIEDEVLNHVLPLLGQISTNELTNSSILNSLRISLTTIEGYADSLSRNLVQLNDRLQNLGYTVDDIDFNLQDFKFQNLELLQEIEDITSSISDSVSSQSSTLNTFIQNFEEYRASFDGFYTNTTNSLSQITSKLMVLASIDQSTAGTYTNLYNLSVHLTNGVFKSSLDGIYVDLGPTNQLKHTLYPGGLTYSSYYNLDPSTVTAAGTTFYISKSGYLNRIVDTLLRTEMYIRDVKKASMITAEDTFWMTNYLGNVQQPLLTSIDSHSSSIDSSTSDILSILREMRQSDSNNLEQISQAKNTAEQSAAAAGSQQPFNLSYTASVGDLQLSDYFDADNVFASLPTPNQAPSDIVFSVGTYKVGNTYLFNDEQVTINVPRNMEVVLQICRAASAFLWWLLVAFIVKCLWSRVVWLYEKVVAFTSSIAQV